MTDGPLSLATTNEGDHFHHVACLKDVLAMLGTRNHLPIHLDGEISRVELSLLQQIADGGSLSHFVRFAVQSNVHKRAWLRGKRLCPRLD